jgi:hypothetical protein
LFKCSYLGCHKAFRRREHLKRHTQTYALMPLVQLAQYTDFPHPDFTARVPTALLASSAAETSSTVWIT